MELLDWYAVFNDRIQLVNFYGATETTMIRSFFRISPADARQVRIPIGEPIADTQLLIANTDGKPCKTFIPGDLYIISKYFTKGYLNAPDLNREKFITLNPGGPDEKLAFKTGDKARMLPGGIIDLIGREDRQVKLRGIRIELDEIENVFFQSGKVENAVVYKQVDENKNELLVAFVISRMDADADVAAGLQPYLEEHLPAYMIPSDIVVVPEFPLLSNGKINFRELLNSLTVTDIVAPVNDIETRLLALWKEIIGDRPISTEDSFHKAGGSSLGIMNLIGKIQKVYDVKITLSQLFSNPTIKKQALFIENAKQKDPLLIGKAEPKPAYNLSSGQTAVYQRLKDEKDSVSHHHNLVLKLNGPADEARIASALRSLISRHEVLRTEFVLSGGRLQQVIKDEVDFRLEPTKMTAQSVDEFIPQSEQPFELGRAPLMRAGLVVDSNGEQLLLVEIHPMVCDRHSLGGIVNDFLQLFEGQQLKMTELQYRDYSEWEQQFKTTTDYIACREFWLKPFDGEFTQVELPYSHTNDEAGEEQNGSVTFRMDKWRLGSIVDRLTKDGITIDAGLLSILFLHLSQLTGQKDLTAGVAVNGRFRSELNEVAGVFEKLLPLRCHIDEDQSFNELAATIHEYLQQAKTKQAYDMTDLVAELNRNRNSTITTLFDVVFDYNAAAANNQQIESDVFQPVEFGRTPKAFPLTLTVTEGDSSFSFRFEWIAACFSKTDIVLLVSQFKDLLTRLAEDPRAPVGETSLVTSN
jgi:acyl carrier protein